ncbi:MAG: c-type cytochrome [Acidobacteriota bacterium]|nr:c-type cytochrome [Acidobacteriota bacterium]
MIQETDRPRRVSRAAIACITIAILLALDAARSIEARRRYGQADSIWQPRPEVYADLAWPPGAGIAAKATTGQRVFARHCAVCHGPDGRGNGPAAPSLIPHPRDFTLGLYKFKSTPPGVPPTDDDLVSVVTNGLQASAMPYFRDILTAGEIRAVVAHVRTLSPAVPPAGQTASITIPLRVAADAASIARGANLFAATCAGCHGADGRHGGTLKDAKGYLSRVPDLTAPWTFHGGGDPAHIWLHVTTGLAGSSMPAYLNAMSGSQRWDVVNYVMSRARRAPWESGGRLEGPGHQPDLLLRGEYLVRAEMCGLCHTQINRTGIYRGDDFYLAGGMRVIAYPQGVFITRNLTSDRASGLGKWSEQQIMDAVRNGRAPDRTLNFWGMPWMYLHALHDDDARAIARYLKSLPAVRNFIPPAAHYGIAETIASKAMRPMPTASPTVLSYRDGNFGRARASSSAPVSARLLAAAQGFVFLGGVVAWIVVTPRGRRTPRGARPWIVIILLVFAGLAGWILYALPALPFLPPDQVAAGAVAGIPELRAKSFATPEQAALAERGRYLYTVASCAFCHGNDGAGGLKVSWRPFGTLWARNITPDAATGLGRWTDAEIARAIRSGVTADGRVLHWQGMIWDHASNWDEEDIRAIIGYLRTLPPVPRQIRSATPPSPDDCATYTFWVAKSSAAGCR